MRTTERDCSTLGLDSTSLWWLALPGATRLPRTIVKRLIQEILLQVWLSIPRFERKAKPSTWIYRVALNTALAWQRRDQRQRRRQFRPFVWAMDVATNESEQAHQRERIERLYTAIRRLPKADAALVLLYLDDLSYREIAEILGISEVNVGVKLNRAKKALAELMKEEIANDS